MFFESFFLNFIIILVLIISLLYDYITKFFSYWYVRHIPYKTPIPCFGSDYKRVLGLTETTDVVRKIYLKHPKEKYVGYIKARIPDLIVRDLDVIQQILSSEFAHFNNKGLCLDKSPDICIKNNLFYVEGEKWTLLREQIEAILSKSVNWNVSDRINEKTKEQSPGKVNINEFLLRTMDQLLVDNVIGSDIVTEFVQRLRFSLQKRSFGNRFKSYLKSIFPSLYTAFGINSLDANLMRYGRDVLSELNEKSLQFNNYIKEINKLLNIRESNNTDITFSILFSIISEAYIPCYNVILAILYELAENIDFQSKAREAIELSQRTKATVANGSEDYLDGVIKEAIRLYPPYSIITRKCTKTYKFPETDILIDKEVTVCVPLESLQRDGTYFKDPEKFDPDRFVRGNDNILQAYSYIPFGAGPRRCPGEASAHKIIRGIVSSILIHYRLEPCSETPERLIYKDYNFQRVLSHDVWLNISLIT